MFLNWFFQKTENSKANWCPAVWCCAGWADQRLNLDPEPCPGCCGWMLVWCRDCQSLLGAELQAGQLSAQGNLSWLELDSGEGPHQAGGSVDWTCSNLITAVISQASFTFVYSPHLCKTLIAIAACRRVIAENVSQAVAEALKEKLRKKAYLMPSSVAIPEVLSGVSGVPGQNKEPPKYTPETFVLCQPRSNLELPLKETTVKQGKALPVSFEHDGEGMTWGKMEKKHNDEFNPSGQPWSPDQGQKRVAETDLQAAVGEKVVVEPASPPERLVPTGVSDPQGSFQIMLDPNEGTLFLKALKDGAVTNDAKLFLSKELSGLPLRLRQKWQRQGPSTLTAAWQPTPWFLPSRLALLSCHSIQFHWGACWKFWLHFVHQRGRFSSTSTRRKMAPLRSLQSPLLLSWKSTTSLLTPRRWSSLAFCQPMWMWPR